MTHLVRDEFFRSADGLRLRARIIGEACPGRLPLLCLPGLTRTAEDFEVLARALANDDDAPRRVVAVDYRGRGLSDYDSNPANYAIPIEAADVASMAADIGVNRTIILGTSRGGLIGMVLAATRPDLVAGLALNDIGPELDIGGLIKIKSYIADPPPRATWDDAARGLRQLFGSVFPRLTEDDWMAWTRRAFREENGRLVRTYDPKLALSFQDISHDNAPPPLWELFDQMADIPLLSIRGELSDLLSEACVEEMKRRRPGMNVMHVADEGHAPLLIDPISIGTIKTFCSRCDNAVST
ncbi:MAG: alpha/beta hydrolase [Xanthobacteraceae bacterium]|nr:alpha/beta hydrolase [Xanthobacteraceae bacterium]